jgi:DNA gyrase subunit B
MSSQYDASQIKVLEWQKMVRKRPQMFIGSIRKKGLYKLVFDLIYEAIEDILSGECDRIEVEINNDNCKSKLITFLPDLEIFPEGIEFNFNILAKRLQELAYLNAGCTIALKDFRLASNKEETYNYPNGIQAYLAEIDRHKEHLHPEIIYVRGERDRLKVEIALQWCKNDSSHRILSYVNILQTLEGGTHIEGLKNAIVQTINSFLSTGDRIINWEKIQVGLNGIISVTVLEPIFTGCMGTKLDNPEIYGMVNTLVSEALRDYWNLNSQVVKELGDRD